MRQVQNVITIWRYHAPTITWNIPMLLNAPKCILKYHQENKNWQCSTSPLTLILLYYFSILILDIWSEQLDWEDLFCYNIIAYIIGMLQCYHMQSELEDLKTFRICYTDLCILYDKFDQGVKDNLI